MSLDWILTGSASWHKQWTTKYIVLVSCQPILSKLVIIYNLIKFKRSSELKMICGLLCFRVVKHLCWMISLTISNICNFKWRYFFWSTGCSLTCINYGKENRWQVFQDQIDFSFMNFFFDALVCTWKITLSRILTWVKWSLVYPIYQ